MRLLLGTAVAAVILSGTVAATPAGAATKICRPLTGKPGGDATWRIHQIRLTTGFSCRDARVNIASWIGFGAMMDNPRAPALDVHVRHRRPLPPAHELRRHEARADLPAQAPDQQRLVRSGVAAPVVDAMHHRDHHRAHEQPEQG